MAIATGHNLPPTERDREIRDLVLLSPDPILFSKLVEHFGTQNLEERSELEVIIDQMVKEGLCTVHAKYARITPNPAKCRADIARIRILETPSKDKATAHIKGKKDEGTLVTLSKKQVGEHRIKRGEEHIVQLRRNEDGTGLKASIIPPSADGEVYVYADVKESGAIDIFPVSDKLAPVRRDFSSAVEDTLAPGTHRLSLPKNFDPDAPVLRADIAPDMNHVALARRYDIPLNSTFGAQKGVRAAKDRGRERKKDRLDFTDEVRGFCFTADPEGSDVFDDALAVYKDGADLVSCVFILDGATWIAEGSDIDKAASELGETLYFRKEGSIGMYPDKLKAAMSLKAGRDNPVRCIRTRYGPDGTIKDQDLRFGVINPDYNFTYERFLRARDGAELPNNGVIDQHFEMLRHTSLGAYMPKIARESGEPDLNLGRTSSHGQIYVSVNMLVANIYQAQLMQESDMPGLFRIHGGNNNDLLVTKTLRALESMGYDVPTSPEALTQEVVQSIKEQADQRGDGYVAHNMLFENLIGGGVYSTTSAMGHLGLGVEFYTHGSSDGRRYADTTVGRILHAIMPDGDPLCALSEQGFEGLPALAETLNDNQARNRNLGYQYSRYHALRALEQSYLEKDMKVNLMRVREGMVSLFHPVTRYRLDIPTEDLDPNVWQTDQSTQILWYASPEDGSWHPVLRNDPLRIHIDNVDVESGDSAIQVIAPTSLRRQSSRDLRASLGDLAPNYLEM